MRWSRALVAAMFVLAVAACSSPAASSGDGNGDGNGNGGSSNPPASQAAPQSQDDGGNGGNGGNADDVFNALIPPNSTEVSRTTAGGTFFATFTSTDSIESLTDHYESAIPGTGMEIFSTTSAQGGTAWIFADSEGSSFGGSVSVFPNTDGGGSAVTVTVSSDS